jgi:hypothetical protein
MLNMGFHRKTRHDGFHVTLLSSDGLADRIEGTSAASVLLLEHIGLSMWTAHYTPHK